MFCFCADRENSVVSSFFSDAICTVFFPVLLKLCCHFEMTDRSSN